MPYTDVEIKQLRKRTAWIAGSIGAVVAAVISAIVHLSGGSPEAASGSGSGAGSADAVGSGSADASGSSDASGSAEASGSGSGH